MRGLRIGDVLDSAFRIYRQNALRLVLVSLAFSFPLEFAYGMVSGSLNSGGRLGELLGILVPGMLPEMNGGPSAGAGVLLLMLVPGTLLASFYRSILLDGAMAASRDGWPRFRGLLGRAWNRLPGVLAVSLLEAMALIVGFLLCVIPGVVLSIFLGLGLPVLVFEKCGPAKALDRSARLVGNAFWTVTGATLIMGFIVDLLKAAATIPLLFCVAQSGGTDPLSLSLAVWTALVTAALDPILMVLKVVLYSRLREEREGTELELRVDHLTGGPPVPS